MHIVVMGDAFTGIVHPCKVYNILRIGLPVMAIGPEESHIADVLRTASRNGRARVVRHGDVDLIVSHLIEKAEAARPIRQERDSVTADRFSKSVLMPLMMEALESTTRETT
jgi:hypothetical protein